MKVLPIALDLLWRETVHVLPVLLVDLRLDLEFFLEGRRLLLLRLW